MKKSTFSVDDTTSAKTPTWFDQICSITTSEKNQLSTLTIHESPSRLYFSILEYAFLCQLPRDHPLYPPDTIRDAPLVIRGDDSFEPTGLDPLSSKSNNNRDSDSDEEDENKNQHEDPGRQPSIPKFKLGLGLSAIVWPPPKSLDGAYLSNKRNEYDDEYYQARLDASNANSLAEFDHSNPYGIDIEAVSLELDANVDNTIYLMHYSTGDPVPDMSGYGNLYTQLKLVTASSKGSAFLRNFAVKILEWRSQKDRRDTNGKGFTLHRFMTDNCGGGWWENEGLRHARPPSSVILPDGELEQILEDVERFLDPSTRRWYIMHGLPHRRSYLLYGPPGTGKTSTIRAIASKFNLNCCFLSMTNSQFSNQLLGVAISQMPSNGLLVLEDVDALFNMKRKSEGNENLTYSGLLNALDGVISADRSITVMTTNFVERLDEALIRGGRVDRRFQFSLPTEKELQKLFLNFYPKAEKSLAERFGKNVTEYGGLKGKSIATLQQIFISHRDNSAEKCVESVKAFFDEIFEHENVEADLNIEKDMDAEDDLNESDTEE